MSYRFCVFLVLSILPGSGARAEETSNAPATPTIPAPAILRVAVVDSAPFSFKTGEQWQGLMIDAWTQIGVRRGVKIEWVPTKWRDLPDLFAAGKVDIGPPAAITGHSLKDHLYTIPLFSSSLCIVTLPQDSSTLGGAYHQFVASGVLKLLGAILLLNLVIGFLLWLIERKRNPEHFGGKSGQGFAAGVWCAVTTMMTVGYGDKVPITWAGRLLCFVVMLTGVVIISLFTATAGATLTVSHLQSRVNGLADLRKVVSVTTNNSPAADFLRNNGYKALYVSSFDEAIKKLASGEAAAFIHDRLRVQTRLRKDESLGVVILPVALKEDYYACTLPAASPYQGWVNQSLEELLESDEWQRIRGNYLSL